MKTVDFLLYAYAQCQRSNKDKVISADNFLPAIFLLIRHRLQIDDFRANRQTITSLQLTGETKMATCR